MFKELLKMIPLLFLVAEISAAFIFCLLAAFGVLAAIATVAWALVMLAAYGATGQLWSV